jgi:peptide deformylase
MAQLHILQIENPEEKRVLKTPCRPIKLPDKRLKQLIADMLETMHASEGVGLAAPQIGLTIRLLVIGLPPVVEKHEDGTEVEVEPAKDFYFINPRIVKMSRETINRTEACLSLPGWTGDVPRSTWITIEYQEPNGKQKRLRKVDGALGWVLQHEIDHLDGILYTERIVDLSTLKQTTDENGQKEQVEELAVA